MDRERRRQPRSGCSTSIARMIGEAKRVYTIGGVPTARLEKYNGLRAPALHPPPKLAAGCVQARSATTSCRWGASRRSSGWTSPSARSRSCLRLHASWSSATARSATPSRAIADEAGVGGPRGVPAAQWTTTRSCDLYSGAPAVVFAPFDEDYGYVTLEAFLSGKPVVTAARLGRPARIRVRRRARDGSANRRRAPWPTRWRDLMSDRRGERPRSATPALERGAPGDVGRGDRDSCWESERAVSRVDTTGARVASPEQTSVLIPAFNEARAIGAVVRGPVRGWRLARDPRRRRRLGGRNA